MLYLRFNCFDYYWIKCYKALKDEKDTWRKNIMKRLLGLLLVLGFVFSSSLYAVAYVDYGYSSINGVVEDAYGTVDYFENLFQSYNSEPYVYQYCDEEQMSMFLDYVECTYKFTRLNWGVGIVKLSEDVKVRSANGWGDEGPEPGIRFSAAEDFAPTDDYLEILLSGGIELDYSYYQYDKLIEVQTCWDKGWGNGTEVYDFKKARIKDKELWDRYFGYSASWFSHFAGSLRGVIEAYYNRNYPSELIDKSCAQFVSYCSTGLVSDKDISHISSEKARAQVYKYRDDDIDVIFTGWNIGGPTNATYLVVTPDDCLRYYKKADIAFSEPYVLGGK
jgi:hypothetical protein